MFPNISGGVDGFFNFSRADKAFSLENQSSTVHALDTMKNGYHGFSFEASRVSSIYSPTVKTVQVNSLRGLVLIRAY